MDRKSQTSRTPVFNDSGENDCRDVTTMFGVRKTTFLAILTQFFKCLSLGSVCLLCYVCVCVIWALCLK